MTRRPGRARERAVVVVLLLVGLTGAISGCASASHAVSQDLAKYELPFLGRQRAITAVADWRELVSPTKAVRDYFGTQRSTYRVISAHRDRATLAVWRTDMPFGQPFGGDESGTGHGCVTLRRDHAGTRSTARATVVDCPPNLGDRPDDDQTSWGRDSNAVAAAQSRVTDIDLQVTAYVAPDVYAQPSTHTRAELLTVIRASQLLAGTRLQVALAPAQPPGRFRAIGSLRAGATDPVDTHRTVSARRCFVVALPLSGRTPTSVTTTVACG